MLNREKSVKLCFPGSFSCWKGQINNYVYINNHVAKTWIKCIQLLKNAPEFLLLVPGLECDKCCYGRCNNAVQAESYTAMGLRILSSKRNLFLILSRCNVIMSMFVASKWQRVALPKLWRASVCALFFCYHTFLDHKPNSSWKVRAPRRVGSAKQSSKLSLRRNENGQNITTPREKSL